MRLFALFIVLGLKRYVFTQTVLHHFKLFDRYRDGLLLVCHRCLPMLPSEYIRLFLALSVLFFAGVIQIAFAHHFYQLPSFILATLVLFYLLRDVTLFRLFSHYLASEQDPELSLPLASQLTGFPVSANLSESDALAVLLQQSVRHVFGVMFWFLTCGISGALFFAFVAFEEANFADPSDLIMTRLYHYLIWPVERLLVLSFGLLGQFVPVLNLLKQFLQFPGQGDDFLRSGLSAALQFSETEESFSSAALSLLQRTFIFWLAVSLILVFAVWIF